MIKLVKYLTPFINGAFASVLLLFDQAFCDMSLPFYMSNIVNIGTQKRGIAQTTCIILTR